MPADSQLPTPPPLGVENYQLGPEISTGGMGSVLEAKDGKLDRTVAIKVMLLEANADERMRQRFIREAQVLAMLAHPNIVPIYDIVWEDGMPLFYSMKLVMGRTLQAILTDLRHEVPEVLHDFPLTRLLDIFRKACDAIAFAHSKGVLHRDLKPDNIMVGEFGEVMVMDWGLAKRQNDEPELVAAFDSSFLIRDSSFTLHGCVLGTPQYMSPEQARGQSHGLDERADVYALGGILYAILTLRPPVEGKTPEEVLSKVTSGQITAPSDLKTTFRGKHAPFEKKEVLDARQIRPLPHLHAGQVPVSLSSVVMKALQLDKEMRYENVPALSAEIESYLAGFATNAEQAGTWKQLQLLISRHKAVSSALAALLVISIAFVIQLISSEHRTETALAKAQIALADVAYQNGSAANMMNALDGVPAHLRDQTWDYLARRRDFSLGLLEIPGLSEHVSDVCALPAKPAHFALAGHDGRIGIVDVISRKLLRTLDTHDPGDVWITVSLDGRRLLSWTDTVPRAHLFDLTTGDELKSFQITGIRREGGRQIVRPIALNRDGTLAAFAQHDPGQVQMIDTATGAVRWTAPCKPRQLLFHRDGKRLFVLQYDDWLLLHFDVQTGASTGTRRLFAHGLSMDIGWGGDKLAVGLISGDVMVFDLKKSATIRQRVSTMPVAQVSWTAGNRWASGDDLLTLEGGSNPVQHVSNSLHLWKVHGDGLESLGLFLGIKDYAGTLPLNLHLASHHLLTGQSPPQLWHLPNRALGIITPGSDGGMSCQFLTNTVLLSRLDGRMTRFDLTKPHLPQPMEPAFEKHYITSAVHLATGLFATACPRDLHATDQGAVILRQHTREGIAEKWRLPASSTSDFTEFMDFDLHAERLLRDAPGGWLEVWEVKTGKLIARFEPKAKVAVFAGARGGIVTIRSLTTADNRATGIVSLLDATQGHVIATFETDAAIQSLAASPDRRLIAIGSDTDILILDADTLHQKHRFRAHDAPITALCFHPHTKTIATGSQDHSVKLWDYTTARRQQIQLGIDGYPRSLSFSPDAKLLAIDGRTQFVRMMSVDEGHGSTSPQ